MEKNQKNQNQNQTEKQNQKSPKNIHLFSPNTDHTYLPGHHKFRESPKRLRMQLHTGSESKVQTHMREDCDINNILNKYQKTGVLPHLIKQQPEYGDFSSPLEFQESLNLILKAQEQFEALPSRTRERFGNEPGAFLQFATDPANKEEMAKLGLLSEDAMAALREPKTPPLPTHATKTKKGEKPEASDE